jgi:hypothetical protein
LQSAPAQVYDEEPNDGIGNRSGAQPLPSWLAQQRGSELDTHFRRSLIRDSSFG